MTLTEITNIIGEKNENQIPLTEEEMRIALQFYTEKQIRQIKHTILTCSVHNK